MSLRIGQKVVCIREIEIETRRGSIYSGPTPVLDAVYTVTGFGDTGLLATNNVPDAECGITVAELRGPQARMLSTGEWTELAWPVAIFRPMIERETDISFFTAMLTSNKHLVDA